MHDASPESPEHCWLYGRGGELCSREEDFEKCYIWEGRVNALTDEHLTTYFTMPNFDVVLEFGLWRKIGSAWVKDDEARLEVNRIERKIDVTKTLLMIGCVGVGAYFLSQVAKFVKR